MSITIFDHIKELPEDPILGLASIIKNDPRANKIDLTIGIYRNENGDSCAMDTVVEAEKIILKENHAKVYLPIDGDPKYLSLTLEEVLSKKLWEKVKDKSVVAQAVGGTSALFILASFFSKNISSTIWIPDPTWPNHQGIFNRVGCSIKTYPYYDMVTNQKTIDKTIVALSQAKEHDMVLLHGCCHNPSGKDPTIEEWKLLLKIIKEKNLITVFDLAYQGFGRSLEEDVEGIRLFVEAGIPVAIALSHSKNFGLYAERVGALFILTDNDIQAKKVLGNIKSFIRTDFSNPPKHGALVVSKILSDISLKQEWKKELIKYQSRIANTRDRFNSLLQEYSLNNKFSHLKDTYGMFCFTGLTKQEVDILQKEHAIFMTGNGRINITGLTDKNIEYVAKAIANIKK